MPRLTRHERRSAHIRAAPAKIRLRLAACVALAMSWSAGFVDAGCYQRLRRTYTSHITGATASMGSHMARGLWPDGARYAWAIASFVLGLLIGASLRHIEYRQRIRSAFSAVLALEIVLLLLFIGCSAQPWFPLMPLVFFAATAMGMQTVTVNRVGNLRVYTTFHTGSLSKFAESLTGYLFWAWDRACGRSWKRLFYVLRVAPRREKMQHAALCAGIWFMFLLGALAGTAAVGAWGSVALLCSMPPLAWAITVDWRRPEALGERNPGTDLD